MTLLAKPIRPSRRVQQRIEAAARVAGCVCSPDVELTRYVHDKLQYANVHHDEHCPALAAGRMAVVIPERRS